MMQRLLGSLLLIGGLAACQAPVITRSAPMPVNRNAALAAAFGVKEDAKAVAQREFRRIDANSDSALTEAEYIAAQTADYKEADLTSVRTYLQRQFAKFDRNKNKRLSFAEYIGT
ncbi:MAG: EF-hand domain-containing protein [Candidatus Sericytochromatia bacterium]|nr:EF-hand domain-containing protein [Candidatus Sericytochromatia bacterium]